VRVLIFHGYLLRGTGSNVYNANLARALVRLGHEVHLLCQDRAAAELDFVDAVADWDSGSLEVRALRDPVRLTAYRPALGGLLPVYVADRYEGIEARPFGELDDEELARYLDANVAAVAEVAAAVRPDAALANHMVMGPAILARALGADVPYAVKIHGSAMEYTVAPEPERFLPYALEGLRPARGVLVGSRHIAERLWETTGDPELPARTRLGPPGVDVELFAPREPAAARAGIAALGGRLAERAERHPAGSAFARDTGEIARALRGLAAGEGPLVAYVGKLILSKGVDLLAAAWPLVLAEVPDARLAVVGFGAYRDGFERLLAALAAGDLEGAAGLAAAGRAEEGGARAPLRHLLAFLGGLEGERRAAYRAAATGIRDSVTVVGRLEHDELAEVLPAAVAQVVPSTFPEAFGMVAAEAAACGVLPVVAAHSGLAEVAAVLERGVPAGARELLTFPRGDDAVEAIARRLVAWLAAPEPLRARTREALVRTARERFSWEGVARGVLAAATGDLEALPEPAPDGPRAGRRTAPSGGRGGRSII